MAHQPNPFFSTVLNQGSTTSHGSSSSTSSRPTSSFTPTQRSQQARNQPFHTTSSSAGGESFDVRAAREEAAQILESVELLLWYSTARNESIPQTRFYYESVLRGVAAPKVLWKEEWEIPPEQRVNGGRERGAVAGESPGSAKGKERERGRDKGRKKV